MGLDQYMYVAARAGQYKEYWEGAEYDPDTKEYKNPKVSEPREIGYRRKHPNLQGWMESLWKKKMHEANQELPESEWDSSFNGIELELTGDDLDALERAVTHGQLPCTTGFFFGSEADDHYRTHDLEFIKNARAELFLGLKVFYNSSW